MSQLTTRLLSSAQARRSQWDKVPWCSLSIELTATVRKDRCFVGIALIDRRQVGWLVNSEPRSFRLEPGEHTITVYFAASAKITMGKMATITRRIVLQPGEQVRLLCGRTPQAMALWKAHHSEAINHKYTLLGGAIFFGLLGWLVHPSLRAAVASATLRLQLGQPWLSLIYLPVRSRPGAALFGFFAWVYFFMAVVLIQGMWLTRRLAYRSLEPYFLVRVEMPDERLGLPVMTGVQRT
jgi:hypothetical protein